MCPPCEPQGLHALRAWGGRMPAAVRLRSCCRNCRPATRASGSMCGTCALTGLKCKHGCRHWRGSCSRGSCSRGSTASAVAADLKCQAAGVPVRKAVTVNAWHLDCRRPRCTTYLPARQQGNCPTSQPACRLSGKLARVKQAAAFVLMHHRGLHSWQGSMP